MAAGSSRKAAPAELMSIGEVLSRDMTRIAGYIFAGLPVAHSDTGDYLVRNLLGVDPQRGLLAIGEIVEPGAEVLFCRRDAATAHEDMRRMLAVLQSGLGDRQPRAGLYVSCLARGPALFGSESAELGLIAETFSNALSDTDAVLITGGTGLSSRGLVPTNWIIAALSISSIRAVPT